MSYFPCPLIQYKANLCNLFSVFSVSEELWFKEISSSREGCPMGPSILLLQNISEKIFSCQLLILFSVMKFNFLRKCTTTTNFYIISFCIASLVNHATLIKLRKYVECRGVLITDCFGKRKLKVGILTLKDVHRFSLILTIFPSSVLDLSFFPLFHNGL